MWGIVIYIGLAAARNWKEKRVERRFFQSLCLECFVVLRGEEEEEKEDYKVPLLGVILPQFSETGQCC